MPEIPRMKPGRRCFARIDRFECSCPHCGRLIFAGLDKKFLPTRLAKPTQARAAAKQRPLATSVLRMYWNPYTQRLECPWCEHVFSVGVIFYPVTKGTRRNGKPAPDVEPTPAEVAEMRRLAGGWFVQAGRQPEEDANLVVTEGCCCPLGGVDLACPLHAVTLRTGTSQGGESAP